MAGRYKGTMGRKDVNLVFVSFTMWPVAAAHLVLTTVHLLYFTLCIICSDPFTHFVYILPFWYQSGG